MDGLSGVRALRKGGTQLYDAIMIDCMIHGEIPPTCKSVEFVRLLSELLRTDGALAQWVWPDAIETLTSRYLQFFEQATVNRTWFPMRVVNRSLSLPVAAVLEVHQPRRWQVQRPLRLASLATLGADEEASLRARLEQAEAPLNAALRNAEAAVAGEFSRAALAEAAIERR